MDRENLLVIANESLLGSGSAGSTVCGLVEEALSLGKRVTYIALVKNDDVNSGSAPQLLYFGNGIQNLI